MNKHLLIIPIFALLVITMPIAFADEEEYEDDDREGFGVMEREREREHNEEDENGNEIAIGSDTGNIILYLTIAAIAASVAYTGIKVFKTKRKIQSRA